MKTTPLKRVLLGLLMFWAVAPADLAGQADGAPQPELTSPAGQWRGTWLNHRGYAFAAVVRLTVTKEGAITGEITWTLRNSPTESEQPKLGLTAVEKIRGTYDAKNRILTFEGFEKDDPEQIIGLDQYRLLFAENGKVIGGITKNHDTWQGVFTLLRVTENK